MYKVVARLSALLIIFGALLACSDGSGSRSASLDAEKSVATIDATIESRFLSVPSVKSCQRSRFGLNDARTLAKIERPSNGPKIEVLDRIGFEESFGYCERKNYIETILWVSKSQSRFKKSNVQVAMIGNALYGFEGAFLELAGDDRESQQNVLVRYAYEQLLASDDFYRPFVVHHFKNHPWLIDVALKKSWTPDIKHEIREYMEGVNCKVSHSFSSVFEQLNEPALLPLLKMCLHNSGANRHLYYVRTKELNWVDLTEDLKVRWESHPSDLEQEYYVVELVEAGYLPALEYLARYPEKSIHNFLYLTNAPYFNYLTGLRLKPEEVGQWFDEHGGELLFDSDTKKYHLPGSSPVVWRREDLIGKDGKGVLPSGIEFSVVESSRSPIEPRVKERAEIIFGVAVQSDSASQARIEGHRSILSGYQYVQGAREALFFMSPGDRWRVSVPSHYAYGSRALPNIPANSDVIFALEILEPKS